MKVARVSAHVFTKRLPAHATSQSRARTFQTRANGCTLARRARARSIAMIQECRRKTCKECDEILHLVCTHLELTACMHPRRRELPPSLTKIYSTCFRFTSSLVAGSSLSMHPLVPRENAELKLTGDRMGLFRHSRVSEWWQSIVIVSLQEI